MTSTPHPTVEEAEVSSRIDAVPDNAFRFKTAGWIGFIIVVFWLIIAITGSWIAPYDEGEFVSFDSFLEPSAEYLLGTDYIGRDLLSRLLYGARMTIFMALAATVIASVVGTVMGTIAGLKGGAVDQLISRFNDAVLSFPTIVLGLVVVAALGSSITVLILATGLIYSPMVFRIARALTIDQAAMDYVTVARLRGEGFTWVLGREIFPNIAVPLLVDFGIRLAFAIQFMAGLSFLGLGVQPPLADWGSMVRENMVGLTSGSLAPIFPAIAIATLTIGLNLMVDDYTAHSGRDMAGKLI